MCDAFVGVSQPRAEALKAANQTTPQPVRIRALIDTGASCTCIEPVVLRSLNLTPTGSLPMRTPSTGTQVHYADQFDVSLVVPHPEQSSLTLGTVAVAESHLLPQGFHALIGRDVLETCMLIYDGRNAFFSLAY